VLGNQSSLNPTNQAVKQTLREPDRAVEVFFSIITRQAIRRGSFASVGDLVAAIRRFVDGWNQRCQPFVWVKDADDIMVKATRKRTSGHENTAC
jgi:hypothetical protein